MEAEGGSPPIGMGLRGVKVMPLDFRVLHYVGSVLGW